MTVAEKTAGLFELVSKARVAILGSGLMGGSLAMALRGNCKVLMGADPDESTRLLAQELGLYERIVANPTEILPQSDLVILATPVGTIIDLIYELPDLHPGSAVVVDIGSTKAEIVGAMEGLPARFDPIGGHPMCGKEHTSLVQADPTIFHGAPFAFTTTERTTQKARSLAHQLAGVVGSYPVWLTPETHDRWVAATSHLPYLLANTLAAITPAEVAPMIGPGFRSSTRLAASSITMMLDILETNREQVMKTLSSFRKHLGALEDLLAEEDYVALAQLLAQGASQRSQLVDDIASGDPQ